MSPIDEVANWEIFLWALYHLGGSSQFVDIENVALECFEIAPARFGWRTRRDLPDYKKCAKALQEAEARRPQMLVKTRDTFGRQLTAEGQKWIETNSKRLSHLLNHGVSVPEPKQRPTSRMMAEIEQSEAFTQWKENSVVPQEKWRMADVLRCSPDSNPVTWSARLESARGIAYDLNKKSILQFLDEVAVAHPDWFGGK
jgi:hypothetical protein